MSLRTHYYNAIQKLLIDWVTCFNSNTPFRYVFATTVIANFQLQNRKLQMQLQYYLLWWIRAGEYVRMNRGKPVRINSKKV